MATGFFYNFELKQWAVGHDNKILKFFLYDGIRKLFVLSTVLLLLALLFLRKNKIIRDYRQGLLVVFFSALTLPLIVGGLKATTNVPCPKDISHYGGSYPYVTVFTNYPKDFHQDKK